MTDTQGQFNDSWGGNATGLKTLLAYISGSVDEELLNRNESLAAENRILRDQIKGRVQLIAAERQTLAEIGKKLGKKALEEVAHIVKSDTILAWQRKLAADTFDSSTRRKSSGRPRVIKNLRIWSSTWPRRIVAGAMTD